MSEHAKPEHFPIGTQFKPIGKGGKVSTIIDVHFTYNLAGEWIQTSYVSEHDFLGRKSTESDISPVTVARGIANMS